MSKLLRVIYRAPLMVLIGVFVAVYSTPAAVVYSFIVR